MYDQSLSSTDFGRVEKVLKLVYPTRELQTRRSHANIHLHPYLLLCHLLRVQWLISARGLKKDA
jgi:hypothetical protein